MCNNYKKVKVERGKSGWGGPLFIQPTEERNYVASVTGGGIHPVANKIAELSGALVIDGFRKGVKFEQLAAVVIDCGGTARVGVYPMKKVPTIDVYGTAPTGPLSRFIKEDIFVSGVGVENVTLVE